MSHLRAAMSHLRAAMSHLRFDELVDLAEGTRAESAAPHLLGCEPCRRQLADLRSTMAAAARVEVPEPSPLFWDHLSERVREAVAADGVPRGAWWRPSTWPLVAWPAAAGAAGAVVAIALAVMLTSRGLLPVRGVGVPDPSLAAPGALSALAEWVDDPSLSLVADLADQMDWDGDAASELGAPWHAGTADEVMGELSAGERIEMRRLLQAELARPGD
jgi:hypothetical protein